MKKVTAVEWLVQKLSKEWQLEARDLYLIEQAKELEKQQDKKMYSEEEVMFAYHQGARLALISQSPLALHKGKFPTPKEWFYENFKNK